MKLPFIFAKRFVAGESFTESIPKAKDLNNKDLKLTLDLLGENVKDRKTATETVDSYIRLLEGIKEHGLIKQYFHQANHDGTRYKQRSLPRKSIPPA